MNLILNLNNGETITSNTVEMPILYIHNIRITPVSNSNSIYFTIYSDKKESYTFEDFINYISSINGLDCNFLYWDNNPTSSYYMCYFISANTSSRALFFVSKALLMSFNTHTISITSPYLFTDTVSEV